MNLTPPSPQAFAQRYRREREISGIELPKLILSTFIGRKSRLSSWLARYTPSTLSTALETVLEDGHRRHGVHTTSTDVARYMAGNTIVPFLLAVLALKREDLPELIAANCNLEMFAHNWLASAPRSQLHEFRRRLEALTVLDPACGTGPFLIAALRVLQQLYINCLMRLGDACLPVSIRRRIVAHNLHGIDLLPEAVELCRLRLRLEMLDRGPMPDDNLHVANALGEHNRIAVSRSADVVLGNPPYLELREVDYAPQGFRCQETGAIHALFIERGLDLLKPGGWMSMIVPMSLVSTQRMKCVQDLLEADRDVWYANFAWRPARLFPNVNRAVTLFVTSATERPRTWTTGYLKWRSRERSHLLKRLTYVEAPRARPSFWVPKLSAECERPLLEKLLRVPTAVKDFLSSEDAADWRIYYRTDGGLYWKVFTDFAPTFACNGKAGHSTRETWLTVCDRAVIAPLIAVLSSDLFWWWYTVTSNCRHLNPIDLHRFPLPASILADAKLSQLGQEYLRDIVRHSSPRIRRQKQTGRTETQTFRIHQSRSLILAIGQALARHYGLTDPQRDYLANYDLAFRMSGAASISASKKLT